jgi:hypothetical protein
MEPTITQNNALYLIQHGMAKHRETFFWRMRIASRNEPGDVRRIFRGLIPNLHRDNGR